MFATIIAFVLALAIAFFSEMYVFEFNPVFLALLMIVTGTVILVITSLIYMLALIPLQRLEQALISRLVHLFRQDRAVRLNQKLLFVFPLVSYTCAAAMLLMNWSHKPLLFALWLVLFGFAIDLIRHHIKRSFNFLDPFYLIDTFTHEAKKSIKAEQDEALWDSLDSLSELSLQSIDKNKISLSTQTLNAFPSIMHAFFVSSKSIAHTNQDKEVEQQTGRDEASYTLFYLLQRLQSIYNKALQKHLETVCSQVIVVLGKIIVYGAQLDLSMVSLPTHFLGKFATNAQKRQMNEVSQIAISTLLEIAKTILTEINVTYSDLKTPFQTIINSLDSIAKEIFRQDKNSNIQLLIQPLKDLKALFSTEKMASHPDTPAILQSINNVLAEFEALEQVMRTIPPISELMESSTSSNAKSGSHQA